MFKVNSDVVVLPHTAVVPACVCGGLQMIVQSFISSNSVNFRSCSPRLHKNKIWSCEVPQPIDPTPQQ